MAGTSQATGPGSAQWLLDKTAAEPSVLREAGRLIAEGGHSNDACLQARRLVEAAWGLRLPEPEYRYAANLLDKAGRGRLAEIFFSIASTDAELAAARHAWQARMTAVPVGNELLAAQFADGLIEMTGMPVPGVDGAWYQTAVHRGTPLEQGKPAVLVSTMATRELVTGFGSEPVMTAWLRTRERAAGRGPLTEPAVEPLPRLVLEEQVLAWLIRHPDWLPPGFGHQQRTALWTAECRHEIDGALRTAGAHDGREGYPRAVRELRRRTLRAPEWAGDLVGWPHGQWVQQYLWRLAHTSVSENTARGAFQALIAIPAASGPAAGPAPAAGPVRLWPAPGLPARPATAHDQFAVGLYTPHHPRPDSFGARTRIAPPGPQL
jgi:hypothetical protein